VASGFRIQKVAIEGFKGFTTHQEIALDGCHAFLLGQNNKGKSSIVEALRWGLFGSRANESVANRNYSGDCHVEITFMIEGREWHLRRILIKGSRESDPKLTDDQGKEHDLQDVIPQLNSTDSGERTHIIFARPPTPRSRQPEDLSPFERAIYNHLGLTHPRSLRDQLNDFLKTQELEETSITDRLTGARHNIDRDISQLEGKIDDIVGSPPWGNSHPPTTADSENKVREIIKEITGNPPDDAFSGLSLDALIDEAKDALENRGSQDLDELEKEVEEIIERRERLEEFREIQEKIETQQSMLQDKQSEFDDTLENMSLDELQNRVNEKRAAAEAEALRRQIAETASDLLHRDEENSVSCPVCETKHSKENLEVLLQQIIEKSPGATTLELKQLEAQLKQAKDLKDEVQSLKSNFDKLKQEAETIKAYIEPEDVEELSERIKQCSVREASIKEQIDGREDWLSTIKHRLSNLRSEERFHDIKKKLTSMKQSRKRFERVEKECNRFVESFGDSVRAIREAVEVCLNERLEDDLPQISDDLSKVFASLTCHPQYDRLTFDKKELPNLKLQVASSHNPSVLIDSPDDVLNGQAESALNLVPYFTFIQADDALTQVYLVLLDDPTRGFDEEHIKILVERLAEWGEHVQLVLASHEKSRFRSLLQENFKLDSYIVVEPIGWTPAGGPQLKIERHESSQT